MICAVVKGLLSSLDVLTATLNCTNFYIASLKGGKKGQAYPRTGHEGPEREQKYSSTLSLTSVVDGVGGYRRDLVSLFPGKKPGTHCTALTTRNEIEQDRQCTYNVTLRNKYYMLVCVCMLALACVLVGIRARECACSLANPARNVYAPCCDVICGPSVSTIFRHYKRCDFRKKSY